MIPVCQLCANDALHPNPDLDTDGYCSDCIADGHTNTPDTYQPHPRQVTAATAAALDTLMAHDGAGSDLDTMTLDPAQHPYVELHGAVDLPQLVTVILTAGDKHR